jgi:dTDP-4-amino-4,6-dideoxygalactose transaminase
MSSVETKIPLVDLRKQHQQIADEVEQAMSGVLQSMRLFLGPNVKAFQTEFADYLGARHCVGVSDGTMALYLALKACRIQPGDEVITVSHTFFATVEAIVLAGAVPVFVDVDPESLLMDPDLVEAAITPHTAAILPVHLYGRMVDMNAIMDIAKRRRLRVIEDSSQAHGARLDGRAAGTFGDAGTFSFYYSKNLGAYGEAGGVVTNDDDVARRLELLRDHGSAIRYRHASYGVNGRLDELQAAVLRIKLRHLDAWNALRADHARCYTEALQHLSVETQPVAGEDHVHHLFVVQSDSRDRLQRYLESRGIGTGVHYPIPCHLQSACSQLAPVSLPITEKACKRILSLPIYPELEADQVDTVVEAIGAFEAKELRLGRRAAAAA